LLTRTHLWLFVPLLGLFELSAHLRQSTRAPTLEEWREVRGAVAELRKQGELVVTAPQWAEPAARSAFGDALMPLEHVGRADETTFPRAIEVSILGHHAPALQGWREVAASESGRFRFRVLENPAPAKVVFDFTSAVDKAHVFDEHGKKHEPCPWTTKARHTAGGLHGHPAYPSRRHQCRGGDWHFVGITAVEDDQWRGRRCMWAHPHGKKTLVIAYDDVPLGKVIRGYGTLPEWIERNEAGPTNLEVRIDGKSIGRYHHEDGDPWAPFEMSTGQHVGKRASVEFRVSAPHPKDRQFCFVADTR
jgi:hypothetical protein